MAADELSEGANDTLAPTEGAKGRLAPKEGAKRALMLGVGAKGALALGEGAKEALALREGARVAAVQLSCVQQAGGTQTGRPAVTLLMSGIWGLACCSCGVLTWHVSATM